MRAARVLITARSNAWARTAAQSMTGFATSVIGCKVEAGIEAELLPQETPDGRPGVSVLLFGFDADGLRGRLVDRVGQTVLTCPTTACFDGLPEATERVIVGGNFLILATDQDAALAAAEAAVEVMRKVRGVVLPFPGGIVRAGSKVGAKRYKTMIASTNDAYCPTLRGRTDVTSELPEGVNSVLEIVVDGLDRPAIESALRAGIDAACRPGVVAISAGNYGGKLGKHHFPLHTLLAEASASG